VSDKQQAAAVLLVGAAAIGVLFYQTTGKKTQVNLMERSVGNTFDAYNHWCHSGGGKWVHKYPTVIGANCLPQAIQEEDLGLAMRGVDISGGYSQ